MFPKALLVGAFAVLQVGAHMAMIKPPSWHDPDGQAYTNWNATVGWRGAGCTGKTPPTGEQNNLGCISQWYSNGTHIPGNRTLPEGSPLITYQKVAKRAAWDPISKNVWKSMQKNPWMAPGTAPVWSPCGVDGGNPKGCPPGNPSGSGCQGGGYGHGPDARGLPGNTKPTRWTVGREAEVMFGITANHGGGYAYRLCPLPSTGRQDLTEECFQSTPLRFVGDTQWLQYGGVETNRTAIPALRTTEGTYPAGSQWTRNPIPACGTFDGGGLLDGKCLLGLQFPPAVPTAYGFFGMTPNDASLGEKPSGRTLTQWSVVDQVQVPANITAGNYVLSFRIDCEQTPQIWLQCADITVVNAEDVVV